MRHRPGGVGLRSERPGVTGAMGSLMPWDPQPRPVARAAVMTQECTQIGENSPSEPFWAIRVHCCDASCVGWHERPNRHGVPAAPLGGPPLPWPGKQALRE